MVVVEENWVREVDLGMVESVVGWDMVVGARVVFEGCIDGGRSHCCSLLVCLGSHIEVGLSSAGSVESRSFWFRVN